MRVRRRGKANAVRTDAIDSETTTHFHVLNIMRESNGYWLTAGSWWVPPAVRIERSRPFVLHRHCGWLEHTHKVWNRTYRPEQSSWTQRTCHSCMLLVRGVLTSRSGASRLRLSAAHVVRQLAARSPQLSDEAHILPSPCAASASLSYPSLSLAFVREHPLTDTFLSPQHI